MEYKYINSEYLDSVSGGDLSIIKEIVDLFRDQSIEIYGEMKELYAEKKFQLLGLLAHKAKSSVAIMGMKELAAVLKEFELKAKEGAEQEHYIIWIERFGSETREAVSELEDLVSNRLKGNT